MILEQFGKEEESGDGYKVISHLNDTTQIYTYGIKNTGAGAIEATIDMSASENMVLSSKGFLVKKVVKANEIEVMLSAQGGVGGYQKVVKHSAKETTTKK